MDDLVWSVAIKKQAEDKTRLNRLLPDLVKRLKDGMALIATPDDKRDAFLADLANEQLRAIRDGSSAQQEVTNTDLVGGEFSTPPQAPRTDSRPTQSADQHLVQQNGQRTEELLIKRQLERANAFIFKAASTRPQFKGMGTTVAAVHFHHDNITVSHIGDSRVYRLRNGDFEQITVDHSLRMYLVEQGFYTPEEAEKEVAKNVVSRALGIEPSVEGDIQTLQAQSQDMYLICSDGLTDMVNDDALHNILTDSQTDLKEAAQAMLKAANDNGGKDNISVILARVPEASATQEARGRAKLEFVGVSDVGRKRSHNEDSIPFNAALGLAVLADGMGGYNAGDAASAIAVKMIMDAYLEQCQSEMPDLNTQTTSIIAAEVDGLLGGIRNNEPAPERQGPRGSSVQQDYDKLRQLFDLDFPDTQVEQINLGEDTERNTEQQRPDESLKAATSLKVGD